MAKVNTLPLYLHPLMSAPSIRLPYCAVCGRYQPLEQHHIVRRGAGKLYDEAGKEVEKPTITLCGFGNNLQDTDGREYCHGLAHANRLHFRMENGQLEYIVLDTPTQYIKALDMDGWRPL